MKIKAACELTGLTDRTIRYYTDEELISPSFTENYLGRKSYDFTEKDIEELKNISVLRKFDFTIDEIKNIIRNNENSIKILNDVRKRTETTAEFCKEKLAVLSGIDSGKTYSVAELAAELTKISTELPQHTEVVNNTKKPDEILKTVITGIIVWLPFVLSLTEIITRLMEYHYPVFKPLMIILTVISFLPPISMLIIPKTKISVTKTLRFCLLLLCFLSVPVSTVLSCGIITESRTTDFKNYLDFDAKCIANRNTIFQSVFPSWPHYFENVRNNDGSYETIYTDSHYYYRYKLGLDYSFDIYAQWPLDKEEYEKEISRVTDIFNNHIQQNPYALSYSEIKKGDYNCLILYNCYGNDKPFEAVTDNYSYIIFAYNDKTGTVRYIYSESLENGTQQPYLLSLDW